MCVCVCVCVSHLVKLESHVFVDHLLDQGLKPQPVLITHTVMSHTHTHTNTHSNVHPVVKRAGSKGKRYVRMVSLSAGHTVCGYGCACSWCVHTFVECLHL